MSSRHSWCQILWWLSPLYLLFSHKNCIPWLPDWLADRLEGNIWKWQSGNIYFHPNWLARGQCKAMKPIIGFPTQQIGNFKSIYVMFNFEIEMEDPFSSDIYPSTIMMSIVKRLLLTKSLVTYVDSTFSSLLRRNWWNGKTVT